MKCACCFLQQLCLMMRFMVMPIYEFECPNGTITEKFVKIGTKEIICPTCRKKAKKVIFLCNFHLKGGGWFSDGYSSTRDNKAKIK